MSPQYLVDLDFSDLMILPDGRGFLRHVKGYDSTIVEAPQTLQKDLMEIQTQLAIQQDKVDFLLEYQQVPYRVARINSIKGKGYFLRRPKYPIPSLTELGFSSSIVHTLQQLGQHYGIILFAGATGSGKSTSIYSLLQYYLSCYGDIIIAVEDPPEIPMQGYHITSKNNGLWYQIDAKENGGYETAMSAAMRYNPRFIFIGEIRSPIVANEAIRAAVNGHLVLSTIHGNSISGAILALQQLAAVVSRSNELTRSILADGLTAVIHQQLVRRSNALGQRQLIAQMLYFGDDVALRHKIRTGKIEHLNNEIEVQRLKISQGVNLMDSDTFNV